MVQGVGIDQNLNAQIPLELTFKDETGQTVRLGQYFREKPVVLALVYYECPGLCDLILNGLTHTMEQISLERGLRLSTWSRSASIPKRPGSWPPPKKPTTSRSIKRAARKQGWHFLTGDEATIKNLTDTVGFHYNYDPITKQFAHASGIMVLTPEGKISRYFYGIEYKPRDFRLGLVEASANKIGSPADQVLLFCYHYDPTTGKYGMAITRGHPSARHGHRPSAWEASCSSCSGANGTRSRRREVQPNVCSFHFGPKPLPRSPARSITCTST